MTYYQAWKQRMKDNGTFDLFKERRNEKARMKYRDNAEYREHVQRRCRDYQRQKQQTK